MVAAVIENTESQVFIAKRPFHTHQGGLWEFPGGKVEEGEFPEDALKRELFEELGIRITEYEPLIQLSHDYPDKSVFLDVWRVSQFKGSAYGKEGQETCWVAKNKLCDFQFPAANRAILNAAILPQQYLITPEPQQIPQNYFLTKLEACLKNNIKLIQFRSKNLPINKLKEQYKEAQKLAHTYNAKLLINASISFAQDIQADGVHLPASELLSTTNIPHNFFCSASCHSIEEITHANTLGLSFIVISPVLKTTSHPAASPLGWEQFKTLCHHSTIPAYALGGMTSKHLSTAKASGAQGIAAISALWDSK